MASWSCSEFAGLTGNGEHHLLRRPSGGERGQGGELPRAKWSLLVGRESEKTRFAPGERRESSESSGEPVSNKGLQYLGHD